MTRENAGASTTVGSHVPVMVEEVLEWLHVRGEGVYVDCTAGLGGHSAHIARLLTTGHLIALDRDPAAVDIAGKNLSAYAQARVFHCNYDELAGLLVRCGIGAVDGILIDAGVSSMQLDDARRGFTFQETGPLDMRMDTSRGVSACEWLAQVSESELARVLKENGDVGPARRIAAAIVKRRKAGAMNTTGDLAEAVAEALPFVHDRPDETRTVFQAVRMAVNNELPSLEAGIAQSIDVLAPGGRLVVITFHSGEDRVVKRALREAARPWNALHRDGRVKEKHPPRLRLLTPKPVLPGELETRRNPRAHSAKLRAAERLMEGANDVA
jgi:16S rRNA (cytosine1402-N4)-methyltransferase